MNHLHVQLSPRYAGERHRSRRFVGEQSPLMDGSAIAGAIGKALVGWGGRGVADAGWPTRG